MALSDNVENRHFGYLEKWLGGKVVVCTWCNGKAIIYLIRVKFKRN